MTNVMTNAWEIAYEGVEKFGGKVKEYFAEALRIAWDLFKNGGNDMNKVKGIIEPMQAVALEGTEKQIEWASKLRKDAIMAMHREVIFEDFTMESMLPNGRPTTEKRNVSQAFKALLSVGATEEHLNNLPEFLVERTINTMNGILDRYNRLAEIAQNADVKFWIDNRNNQKALNKYVNTGIKEY